LKYRAGHLNGLQTIIKVTCSRGAMVFAYTARRFSKWDI